MSESTKTFPFIIPAMALLLLIGGGMFFMINSIEIEKANTDTREQLAEEFAAKLGKVISKTCGHPTHNFQSSSCAVLVERIGVLTIECYNDRCEMESVVPLDVVVHDRVLE